MISSMSSTDRAACTTVVPAAGQPPARPLAPRSDQLSTESAALLKTALQRQPEIRPDVLASARALAADPNYPPVAVMKNIAAQILAAPDLSEDES
jgi:hypothetical protein